MSIDQEKMIVEALSSLYPLKDYEEEAINVVINALPRWIPTSERLPKTDDPVLVTLYNGAVYEAEYIKVPRSESYWNVQATGYYELNDVKAWCEKPEPYKGDTEAVMGTDKNVGTTKEQCENCIHCSGAAGNVHCFNCAHYYEDNFIPRRE